MRIHGKARGITGKPLPPRMYMSSKDTSCRDNRACFFLLGVLKELLFRAFSSSTGFEDHAMPWSLTRLERTAVDTDSLEWILLVDRESIGKDRRSRLAGRIMLSVEEQVLRRSVGKAIHRYQMIKDGDRIAVGVSGGKDSLSLLELLAARRRRAPISYGLVAIHIDLGFDGTGEKLEPYFRHEGIPYRVEETQIGPIAHSETNRENPCFLCARMRRKRLFELASLMGCTKIALGHHRDDIIETLLINMFYSGEIATMVPHQRLFKGKLSIIRPLALTDEDAIGRYARAKAFPVIDSGCPTMKDSKRNQIKAILAELVRKDRRIKGNIFRSMRNIREDYLP